MVCTDHISGDTVVVLTSDNETSCKVYWSCLANRIFV